ncbi:MAG: hypothetical protein HRT64_02850 [Erythrobacter sp.]|nr:hypothetical protein [Erythrobacter sp.]
MNSAVSSPAETVLRDELARADRALGGVAPVLEHVLAGAGQSLLSDAIVARVRGMLNDLANQFVRSMRASTSEMDIEPNDGLVDRLASELASDTPILVHCHAMAMEGVLTDRLDQRSSIDPILSPLWQELIASEDAAVGETAMQALTAQSRFMQTQRRMQQPALDLPAEVLERALRIWARSMPVEDEPVVTEAMRGLKADYDEAQTRLALIARLIGSMRSGVLAALELEHAGLALFVSALALSTGQMRARAVMACNEQQAARLAIGLRAAGLDVNAVERQFVALEPTANVPRGLDDLSVDAARAIIEDSASQLTVDGGW